MPGRSVDILVRSWQDEITVYMRVMSGLVGVCLFIFGWGPMLNPDNPAYQQVTFDSVREFASMKAWGLGFWTPAILLVVAAISGRATLYVWGTVFASLAVCGWGYFVVSKWLTDENAVFTTGGLALYILSGTFTLGLAFSPHQLVESAESVLKYDSKLIPLRPVDSDIASTG